MSRDRIEQAARAAAALIRPETSGVPAEGGPDGIADGGDLGTQALFLLYAAGL
jgi:hypothetical protein